jgi:hypothetical protein
MPYVLPKNSKYVAACTTAGGKSCQNYVAWSRMVDEPPDDCSLLEEGWDPTRILEEKILATAYQELNELDTNSDEQQLNKTISRLCGEYTTGQSSKSLWKPDQELPQAYRKCVMRDSAHLRTADRCLCFERQIRRTDGNRRLVARAFWVIDISNIRHGSAEPDDDLSTRSSLDSNMAPGPQIQLESTVAELKSDLAELAERTDTLEQSRYFDLGFS